MPAAVAIVVVAVSAAGALAWWRFRKYVQRYGSDVVRLLKLILEELRKGNRR